MPPASRSHGAGVTNTSSRATRSPRARVGSLAASCGKTSRRPSTNPRCVTTCASARAQSSTEARTMTDLPPDRLQREIVILERHVVFELVERQTRPARAAQIGHLELTRGPDALHVLKVRVDQAADELILA